jgi:peptidoglycan/xylan/chitin deacetylase (PgdA/CDA1 family)
MHLKRGDFLKLLAGSTAALCLPQLLGEEANPFTPPVAMEYDPNHPLVPFTSSGPGFGRRVCITFDDGPNPSTTNIVLDELKKRDLKATFFMIGKNVDAFPDSVKKVRDEGHEIANHSYTHPQLGKMPEDKVRTEIERCQESIEKASGIRPVWFRPPYGSFTSKQNKIAADNHLSVVMWSVDPFDWKKPGPPVVTQRVLAQSNPGSIILLHDIHKQTAEAVPAILDGLLERDYTFATMSGFLGDPYLV